MGRGWDDCRSGSVECCVTGSLGKSRKTEVFFHASPWPNMAVTRFIGLKGVWVQILNSRIIYS